MDGRANYCSVCSRKVYVIEKIEANGCIYHKACFKCKDAGCRLTLANFHFYNGELFCPKHVPKLQAIITTAPVKKASSAEVHRIGIL